MNILRKEYFIPLIYTVIQITVLDGASPRMNGCRHSYHTRKGNFSWYPSANGIECHWRIVAASDEKIVLDVTDINIKKSPNCTLGYVEIRDGLWYNSRFLGRFCGNGKLNPITSTSNKMLVSYVVDRPQDRAGFAAKYEAICGEEMFIDGDTPLRSPNHPENYPLDKKCVWKIVVPEGHKVFLRFHSFDLEGHSQCLYDRVEIRDGLAEGSDLIGVYCGTKTPPEILSTKNSLLVNFVSDASVHKRGFSATIMDEYDECASMTHGCAQECTNTLGGYNCSCRVGYELHSDGKNCEVACGGRINGSDGTLTSPSFPSLFPLNKSCTWEIATSPQNRIFLNFTHFNLTDGKTKNLKKQQCGPNRLEIFDKFEDKLKLQGVYCKAVPDYISSSSNVMRIAFKSGFEVQNTGFALHFHTELDRCAFNNGNCRHDCVNLPGSTKCICSGNYTSFNNGRDCESDCQYEISSFSGSITTPNYPDSYSSRKFCKWLFMTTPGHRIRFSITHFSSNYYQQLVTLYDGPSSQSGLLGNFNSGQNYNPVHSPGNEMYVILNEQNNYGNVIFRASYSSVCGGTLLADTEEKHIYSHAKFGYSDYDNDTNCEWTITSPLLYNVTLSFLTFQLEDNEDCDYDYVEIFDGMTSEADSLGQFCGSEIPSDVFSTSSALLLRFSSDDTFSDRGFHLTYKRTEPEAQK